MRLIGRSLSMAKAAALLRLLAAVALTAGCATEGLLVGGRFPGRRPEDRRPGVPAATGEREGHARAGQAAPVGGASEELPHQGRRLAKDALDPKTGPAINIRRRKRKLDGLITITRDKDSNYNVGTIDQKSTTKKSTLLNYIVFDNLFDNLIFEACDIGDIQDVLTIIPEIIDKYTKNLTKFGIKRLRNRALISLTAWDNSIPHQLILGPAAQLLRNEKITEFWKLCGFTLTEDGRLQRDSHSPACAENCFRQPGFRDTKFPNELEPQKEYLPPAVEENIFGKAFKLVQKTFPGKKALGYLKSVTPKNDAAFLRQTDPSFKAIPVPDTTTLMIIDRTTRIHVGNVTRNAENNTGADVYSFEGLDAINIKKLQHMDKICRKLYIIFQSMGIPEDDYHLYSVEVSTMPNKEFFIGYIQCHRNYNECDSLLKLNEKDLNNIFELRSEPGNKRTYHVLPKIIMAGTLFMLGRDAPPETFTIPEIENARLRVYANNKGGWKYLQLVPELPDDPIVKARPSMRYNEAGLELAKMRAKYDKGSDVEMPMEANASLRWTVMKSCDTYFIAERAGRKFYVDLRTARTISAVMSPWDTRVEGLLRLARDLNSIHDPIYPKQGFVIDIMPGSNFCPQTLGIILPSNGTRFLQTLSVTPPGYDSTNSLKAVIAKIREFHINVPLATEFITKHQCILAVRHYQDLNRVVVSVNSSDPQGSETDPETVDYVMSYSDWLNFVQQADLETWAHALDNLTRRIIDDKSFQHTVYLDLKFGGAVFFKFKGEVDHCVGHSLSETEGTQAASLLPNVHELLMTKFQDETSDSDPPISNIREVPISNSREPKYLMDIMRMYRKYDPHASEIPLQLELFESNMAFHKAPPFNNCLAEHSNSFIKIFPPKSENNSLPEKNDVCQVLLDQIKLVDSETALPPKKKEAPVPNPLNSGKPVSVHSSTTEQVPDTQNPGQALFNEPLQDLAELDEQYQDPAAHGEQYQDPAVPDESDQDDELPDESDQDDELPDESDQDEEEPMKAPEDEADSTESVHTDPVQLNTEPTELKETQPADDGQGTTGPLAPPQGAGLRTALSPNSPAPRPLSPLEHSSPPPDASLWAGASPGGKSASLFRALRPAIYVSTATLLLLLASLAVVWAATSLKKSRATRPLSKAARARRGTAGKKKKGDRKKTPKQKVVRFKNGKRNA
eukprot:GHVT01027820.1.p1 GENE.GHVT01027820.1~~GHVT01027820.1.p1  ORF type:complete len:1186 (+),score=120.04 GHVT01027820.1:120-3677(+)